MYSEFLHPLLLLSLLFKAKDLSGIIKLLMIDCQQTQSHEEQSNPEIQFQHCPHCSRKFFKGKLQLHLKLCTFQSPMLYSPKKNKLSDPKSDQKTKSLYSSHQRKCPQCRTKLPNFLFQKHIKKCREARAASHQLEERVGQEQQNAEQDKNSTTDFNFKQKTDVKFPAIKKASRQNTGFRKSGAKDAYQIKARQDLSCFRLAMEIKKVECRNCGRMFAKDAALRHIPVCEKISVQEKYDCIFKRRRSPKVLGNDKWQQMQNSRHKQTKSLLYCKQAEQRKLQKSKEKEQEGNEVDPEMQ